MTDALCKVRLQQLFRKYFHDILLQLADKQSQSIVCMDQACFEYLKLSGLYPAATSSLSGIQVAFLQVLQ